jgi:hypothetical protein
VSCESDTSHVSAPHLSKGEMVRQERTGVVETRRPGKPHPEQGYIGDRVFGLRTARPRVPGQPLELRGNAQPR